MELGYHWISQESIYILTIISWMDPRIVWKAPHTGAQGQAGAAGGGGAGKYNISL